ncbi:MAG: RCC1 domain-containing protein, partial [Ilumatobacteraceae bacterium]
VQLTSANIDVTAPTLSTTNVPSTAPLTFVFSIVPDDSLEEVDESDFVLSGTARDCSLQVSSRSTRHGLPIHVAARCLTSGTLEISLPARSVTDAAGNPGPATDLVVPTIDVDEFAPRGPRELTLGSGHSCALLLDGRARCWGFSQDAFGPGVVGNFGDQAGEMGDQTPVLQWGRDVLTVSLGGAGNNLCGLLSDGSIRCMGPDADLVPNWNGESFASVSSGPFHSCAVTNLGTPVCWGHNAFGQFGDGTTSSTYSGPVEANTTKPVVAISAGGQQTCAILVDGSLQCWGSNACGQLGVGDYSDRSTPTNVSLGAGLSAVAVSVGQWHTCVLLDNGTVKCWGLNIYGQLGDGGTTSSNVPGSALSLGVGSTPRSISSGLSHSCVLFSNGTLRCWGSNNQGQLGQGDTQARLSPTSLDFGVGTTVEAVGLGDLTTCAALASGSVKCLGANHYGQLGTENNASFGDGTGETPVSANPVRLADPPLAIDTTGIVTTPRNPLILKIRFDHRIKDLTWQDFGFTGPLSASCFAAPAQSTAEANEDIEVWVSCNQSGDVSMSLRPAAVQASNGVRGPDQRFYLGTIAGLDVAPPRVVQSSTPTRIRNGSTFSFATDKWFEGIEGNDFAYTGTASGCTFSPNVDRAAAGQSVEVTLICATEGTIDVNVPASSFFDANGNPGPMPSFTFVTMIVDNTAPTATIEMPSVAPTEFPFAFSASFSEHFSGLGAGDFVNSGTAQGCSFTPAFASGIANQPVAVSVSCTSGGTVHPELRIAAVIDEAGNSGPTTGASGGSVTIITNGPASGGSPSFTSVAPSRVMDTRDGTGGIPATRVGNGTNDQGTVLEFDVRGKGGLPTNATQLGAVSLNVTAANTRVGNEGGWVAVYPCGTTPNVSNLNFTNGQITPNAVITPTSTTGKICFKVYGQADLIVDINGWFAPATGFTTATPSRVMDTRDGTGGVPATRVGNGTNDQGTVLEFDVRGKGGLPTDATQIGAVSLNVTAANTTA